MESLSLVETPATLDHRFTKHRHEPVERLADSLETSSRDHRLYRVVELENKLKVALIHDAKTDMASVTMNINVGSMSDYKDMPGIAHAVECEIPFLHNVYYS
jgi:secreted Zn-dependent insulinase-like peptidase